jgi:hypothetical protein
MATEKAVLSARIEPEYITSLDAVAKSQRISRSKLLREFALNAATLYEFLKAEKERQQTEKITLNGNLSQWVVEHTPPHVTSEFMHFLGEVIHHAAEMKKAQEKEAKMRKVKTGK